MSAPIDRPGGRRAWIAVVAAIGVVVALIGAAIALTSLNSRLPLSSPPSLPNCKSSSNCVYPSSVVLRSNASGMCDGGGTSNSCPAQSRGGFGCVAPNDAPGCRLTYNYTMFHLIWSASFPLGVGVGSDGMNCKWFDGGYCTSPIPANSGDQWVGADWGVDGRIWFEVRNPGATSGTISNFTITATTESGAPKPVVRFSGVTKVNAVTWTFSIASAQPPFPYSNYKISFRLGTTIGTPVNMGGSGVNTTVTLSGATPSSVGVTWTDFTGSGQVTGRVQAGNIFTIAFPFAPQTGASLTFYLLYSDGSQIQSHQWQG